MKYKIQMSSKFRRQLKKYRLMPKVLKRLQDCVLELQQDTLSPMW